MVHLGVCASPIWQSSAQMNGLMSVAPCSHSGSMRFPPGPLQLHHTLIQTTILTVIRREPPTFLTPLHGTTATNPCVQDCLHTVTKNTILQDWNYRMGSAKSHLSQGWKSCLFMFCMSKQRGWGSSVCCEAEGSRFESRCWVAGGALPRYPWGTEPPTLPPNAPIVPFPVWQQAPDGEINLSWFAVTFLQSLKLMTTSQTWTGVMGGKAFPSGPTVWCHTPQTGGWYNNTHRTSSQTPLKAKGFGGNLLWNDFQHSILLRMLRIFSEWEHENRKTTGLLGKNPLRDWQ